jgi:uncharacterized membrane protein
MSQPIVNCANTPNPYEINLSEERTESAEFLSHNVYLTNPTSSTQEQAETPQTPQTNVTDRSLTLANSLNTITIKPVNEFSNINEMLDYFNERMDLIYKSHNVELNSKFKRYISQRKEMTKNLTKMYDTHKFLSKLCEFIVEYLTNNNNEILDIMDVIFYLSNSNRDSSNKSRLNIKRKFMNYFISATDKQIKELAVNKNLYRVLLARKKLRYLDLNNINHITNSKKERILKLIDKSKSVESKKSLIKGYTENIFDICLKKDIDIDPLLIKIIKYLLESPLITNEETKQILDKIILFFNYFDDDNNVIDTSILTKICISDYQTLNRYLLSVLNMTDKQIQFITSCKSRYKIIQHWIGKGFPTTEEIDKIIENHKKKNTANNSIKYVIIGSTSYSKLQSNSIDLTETEASHLTPVALDPEQIDDDISKETPTFLNLDVSIINPTSSIQEQAETSQTPQTNITDRSSTLANSLNTITIKPFSELSTKDIMLDYFKAKIALLYKSHGFAMNPKLEKYIDYKKTNKLNHTKIEELYCLFRKLTIFLFVYFKKEHNEILDIMASIFNKDLSINTTLVNTFISLTDKQIQELAANKDLYRSLLIQHKLCYIDLNNIDDFTKSRIKSNKKQEKKLYKFIANSSADDSKKGLIRKCATNIFNICYKKNIDIDNNLVSMIKTLANSTQLTNADTKEILEKIIFFFNSFDDYNTIIDISILTDIICYEHEKTNEQLLLSICNLNNEQIQFITSCKNRWEIMQPWIFKGFPETKNIEHRISWFKKNSITNNSTDVSTGYNNPQSDSINLTNTENSYPTAINFQDTDKALNPEQTAKFDDSIEQLDYKNNDMEKNETEEDEMFAWLDANPNFLAEPNGAINSNPKLILPTKRPMSPSLYNEEHNQNKIPKLDFSFLD